MLHIGRTAQDRGSAWDLHIVAETAGGPPASVLFLNKTASNLSWTALNKELISDIPCHWERSRWVSYGQWDVNRIDMHQFLKVSSKERHMTSSASPSYSCLGFRQDGWVQATIFRPWGRNQCSRSLRNCHVSLGLLTSRTHFCDRKSKFSPTEPLSGGNFLSLTT